MFSIVLLLFLILSITSCASAGVTEYEAGFFGGLWDGFTIMYSLIGSIFDSSISYFAENNSGFLYYLGSIIGVLIAIPVEILSLFLLFSVVFNSN